MAALAAAFTTVGAALAQSGPVLGTWQVGMYFGTSNQDGHGALAATDDRTIVLENRAYVVLAAASAATAFTIVPNPATARAALHRPAASPPPCACLMPWAARCAKLPSQLVRLNYSFRSMA